MEGEQDPVAGQMDVGLEVSVSQGDGGLERGQGVLGSLAAAAAMGEGDRGRSVEKRTLHHGRGGQGSRTGP